MQQAHTQIRTLAPRLQAGSSPFGNALAPVLTLPVLSPGIPASLNIWRKAAATAAMAETLLREGFLVWTGDLAGDTTRALETWGHSVTACLPANLPISFSITSNYKNSWFEDLYDSDCTDQTPIKKLKGGFGLLNNAMGRPLFFDIRATTLRLEKIHPGLGSAVMAILEDSLDSLMGCTGPQKAMGIAQSEHWQGEIDETNRVAEELDQIEWQRKEEMKGVEGPHEKPPTWEEIVKQCNMFTLEEFHKEIPKWLYGPHMSDDAMKKLFPKLNRRDRGIVETVIELRRLTKMRKLRDQRCADHLNDIICSFGTWNKLDPIIMYWKPFGTVGKLYDDLGNHLSEAGEYHAVSAFTAFDPVNPVTILAAMKKMKRLCEALRIAVDLLKLVATQVYQRN